MTPEFLKGLRVQLEARLVDMAKHYQIKDAEDYFDDRLRTAMDQVLGAVDIKDAEDRMKRAEGKMHMHCLSLWSSKGALGPASIDNLMDLAKSRDSLAKFREQNDDLEGAKRLKAQAAEFRQRADLLRAAPKNPPAAQPGPQKGIPNEHPIPSSHTPIGNPAVARPTSDASGVKGRKPRGIDPGPKSKGSSEPRSVRRVPEDDYARPQGSRARSNASGGNEKSNGRKGSVKR